VHELQQVVDVRLSSKTMRRQAQAGIQTTLAQGLDAIRDLDAIVAITTRQDQVHFAAWQSARRIEGLGSSSSGALKPAKGAVVAVSEPAAVAVAEALPDDESAAPNPAPVVRRAS